MPPACDFRISFRMFHILFFLFNGAIPRMPELLTTCYRLHSFHTGYGNKKTISASQASCPSRSLRPAAHIPPAPPYGKPLITAGELPEAIHFFGIMRSSNTHTASRAFSLYILLSRCNFMNPKQGHAMRDMVYKQGFRSSICFNECPCQILPFPLPQCEDVSGSSPDPLPASAVI